MVCPEISRLLIFLGTFLGIFLDRGAVKFFFPWGNRVILIRLFSSRRMTSREAKMEWDGPSWALIVKARLRKPSAEMWRRRDLASHGALYLLPS